MSTRARPATPEQVSPTISSAVGAAQTLVELTKPRVTRMVLLTTLLGAVTAPGRAEFGPSALALLGTAAVVGAANVLNMYLERDVDARMPRTRTRPIPSGRVAPEVALWFGVSLALIGISALTFLVNPESGLLAAIALVSYVAIYTPLKRVTPFALHVGAVPGAIPPLIGWAGVTGDISAAALSLFAILFVWQIPHFLAIAIFREREYECAGLAVYSAVCGPVATSRALLGYSLLLAVASFVPLAFGLGGTTYAILAALLGVIQITIAALGLAGGGERWARRLFFATLPYPLVVMGYLALAAP